MGARPYDPSLGRFLAVDPIDGGSLNNYDYAAQDPINAYDLSGYMFDREVTTESGDYEFRNCDTQGASTICQYTWIADAGSDATVIVTDTRQTVKRYGEVVYRADTPGDSTYESDRTNGPTHGGPPPPWLKKLISTASTVFDVIKCGYGIYKDASQAGCNSF